MRTSDTRFVQASQENDHGQESQTWRQVLIAQAGVSQKDSRRLPMDTDLLDPHDLKRSTMFRKPSPA